VTCARLDTLLEADPVQRLDIVKVDMEGFEAEVFAGATDTFVRFRPLVLFEVNGLIESPTGVTAPSVDALRAQGYEMYGVEVVDEPRWRLVSLGPGEDPSRFRDRWESEFYPPTLLAAHPGNPTTQRRLDRVGR